MTVQPHTKIWSQIEACSALAKPAATRPNATAAKRFIMQHHPGRPHLDTYGDQAQHDCRC